MREGYKREENKEDKNFTLNGNLNHTYSYLILYNYNCNYKYSI